MIAVVHFVMYGSYTAPCGWSIYNRKQNNGSDQTLANWTDFAQTFENGEPCCPGCVEHARRVGVIPWPEVPNLGDRPAVEAWLDS